LPFFYGILIKRLRFIKCYNTAVLSPCAANGGEQKHGIHFHVFVIFDKKDRLWAAHGPSSFKI